MVTCPNIEIEIYVTDKCLFFIRPFHIREEYNAIYNEKILLLRNYERRFSAYSSPVMLITRKIAKDKRPVSNFRHFNVRIEKNNLA